MSGQGFNFGQFFNGQNANNGANFNNSFNDLSNGGTMSPDQSVLMSPKMNNNNNNNPNSVGMDPSMFLNSSNMYNNMADPSSPNDLQSQSGTIQPSAIYSPSLFNNMSPQIGSTSPALSNAGGGQGPVPGPGQGQGAGQGPITGQGPVPGPGQGANQNANMNSPYSIQRRSLGDGTNSVSPHQRPTPLPSQLLQEAHSGSNSPIVTQQSFQQQPQQMLMQDSNQSVDSPLGSDVSQQFNGGNGRNFMFQQQQRMFQNQNQNQNQNQPNQASQPNQPPQTNPNPPNQPAPNSNPNPSFLSTLSRAQLQPIRNQLAVLTPQQQELFIRKLGSLPQQSLLQAIQQLALQQQKLAAAAAQNQQSQQSQQNQQNQQSRQSQQNQQNQPNQQNQQSQQNQQFQFVMQNRSQGSPQVGPQQDQSRPPSQNFIPGQSPGPVPGKSPAQASTPGPTPLSLSTPILGQSTLPGSSPGPLSTSAGPNANISKADQFVKSLVEFMQRRGTPITSFPSIGETRLHPFALYATVIKFGGSAKITRSQRWPAVCQALGFMPTLAEEVARIYNMILRPFEEFLLSTQLRNRQREGVQGAQGVQSPQGPLGLQALQGLQGPQSSQSSPGPGPGPQGLQGMGLQNFQQAQQQQQPLGPPTPQLPGALPPQQPQRPAQPKSRQPSQTRVKQQTASPIPVHMPQPQPQPQSNASSPKLQSKQTPRRTPNSRKSSSASSPALANESPSSMVMPAAPVASVPAPAAAPAAPVPPQYKPVHYLPHEEKSYLPKKRLVEKHGGYDIRVLAGIGREIENYRTDFPFTHELGTFDVHAVAMSVNSTIAGEVRQALDKLVVITADPRCYFSLVESPGLLTGLADNGIKILQSLSKGQNIDQTVLSSAKTYEIDDTAVFEETGKTAIDLVFESYKDKIGKEGVDLVIDVDSLTGVEVGRLEEDIILEDIELKKGELNEVNAKEPTDDSDTIKPFGFVNYLTLLQQSKYETEELGLEDYKTPEVTKFWSDAAIDRLLSITTIIRNLSFVDPNRSLLINEPSSRELLFSSLYFLAENPKLLSNSKQTLDLMKDLVTIFSNLAPVLILDSAKDALVLLLFVLAFTPTPIPFQIAKDGIVFGKYTPVVHRYLPYAVDILAKVLPRDPPNRDLFESIFLGTCNDKEYLRLLQRHFNGRQANPYELMTCTFGLVISTVPHDDLSVIPRGLELARPLLHQSLLVAEMLAEMIKLEKPGRVGSGDNDNDNDNEDANDEVEDANENDDDDVEMEGVNQVVSQSLASFSKDLKDRKLNYNLAYEWLSASDGFGHALLRAACALGAVVGAPIGNGRNREEERNPFARITQRSITILRLLGKKAMEFDAQRDQGSTPFSERSLLHLPSGVLPTIEALLGAMLAGEMDKYVVGQICRFCDEGNDHLVKANGIGGGQ